MSDHSELAHRIIERRLLPDRRRGLDRRVGDRRAELGAIPSDRRRPINRRGVSERRWTLPRRSRPDRRAAPRFQSGDTFSD